MASKKPDTEKDNPFQDPTKVTHTRDLLCSAPSYTIDFTERESYHGRWLIFRNFEDLNETWRVVRDEVMSGRLGAIGASCSTLWYNPQNNGTGPVTTGRIGVYTNKRNYIDVGLELARLVQHDIKYKTLEATRKGEFSRNYEGSKPISSKTVFWNQGRPYAAVNARRETRLCYLQVRNKYHYNPRTDRWKVHIVDGLPEHRSEPVYGKWIVTSNYDYESEVNVTNLWHKLKGDIEHGKLPVIKMECPTKPKESPPEIHVTTSKANMEPIGRSILAVVKHDIEYDKAGNPSEKKILKWIESQSDTDHEDTDSEGEEKVNEEAKPGAGPAAPSGDDDSEDEEQFIEEAMSGEKKIKRKLAHSILVGPPGSGKSSLMDRLLGRPRKEYSSSTGVSESVVVVDVDMTTPSTFHSVTVVDSEWKEVEYHESLVKQIAEEGVNSPTQEAATMNVVTETQSAEVSLDTTSIHDANPISTQATEVGTESIAIAIDKPVSSINSPQVRKIIKSVIKNNGGYKNFKKFLKNSFSIYLRDTGGQLVFQEMLPLLVYGPSIFLFVFRLDQDLKNKFSVEYRKKADEALNRYTSSITIEEAFLQCLASVYAMDVPSKSGVKTHQSLVFVIGTHKDKLGSLADKRIADVNESLGSLIKKSNNFEKLVRYADFRKGQVMFTVDNTSDSDEDFKLIRSRVNRLISKRDLFTIDYPIRYLLFSLELQDTKRNVLSLDECKAMAAKYGIGDDQLLELLEFLHIRVGIIRYFDKEGVRHIVIKETQVLFNVLTNFIIQSFSDDDLLDTWEIRELKQGIFKASLFKDIVGNVDSMLTPDELLQLLVHLRLAVSFTEDREKKYFLPSILTHIPESGEEELTDIPPLAVQFNCGHCPKGLFGVLVTHLMTPDPSQLQGAITSITLIPHRIFKYHVSFEVCSPGVHDKISLKVNAAHLEIKFLPEHSEDRQSLSVCNDIRLTLENCINRSLEDLHYCKSKVSFQLCLNCDQCSELHEVDFANLKLHCQQTRKACCISPKGKWWFSDSEAAAKDSTASAEGRLNKDPDSTRRLLEQDIPAILQKLSKYSYKWKEIGDGLGFTSHELSNIEATHNVPLSCLRAMLSEWQQRAPGDGRGSKSYATRISLQEAVNKAGLSLVAREL